MKTPRIDRLAGRGYLGVYAKRGFEIPIPAEVITFGCSALFWMQPFLQKRLNEMGWEVPVLEGYRCAIELAKLQVDLGVTASGLLYPGDRPRKWRRKKFP